MFTDYFSLYTLCMVYTLGGFFIGKDDATDTRCFLTPKTSLNQRSDFCVHGGRKRVGNAINRFIYDIK